MGFLGGVVQQVIAGLVVLLLTYWLGHLRAVRKFSRMISYSSDLGLQGVYTNYDEAKTAIRSSVAASRSVGILAARGTEFQAGRDGTYEDLLAPGERGRRQWRILLPDADAPPRGEDWITYRAGELNNVSPPYDRERLAQQIAAATQELARVRQPSNFELALYDAPHIGRIILTDDQLFISFYDAGRGGKKGPTFHFRRGEFYNGFGRYFEMIWRDSRAATS
jgi:hypothetical protein